MHTSTKAQMLYNLCNTSDGLFKGKVRPVIVNNVLSGKFADIFKPWRVLQAINSTSGGTVNFSGIDSLRDSLSEDNPTEESDITTDKNGNKRKRHRTFLLPSSYKLKEFSKQLEEYIKLTHINYETDFDKDYNNEYLLFNYASILKFLLKMYKLDILVENTENVEIAITLDSSKLTNRLFHVISGLKIVDVHARHLKLGTLLLLTDVEISGISRMQSCDNSYMVEMCLMKDTKECYKCFTNFFEFYVKVGEDGLPGCEHGLAINKLKVVSLQDMKSHWSCLMKGGAVKKVTYPCHCCNIISNELVKFKVLDRQCDR